MDATGINGHCEKSSTEAVLGRLFVGLGYLDLRWVSQQSVFPHGPSSRLW